MTETSTPARHDDDADQPEPPSRRRRLAWGLISVIAPPLLWLTSLAASYLTQDFTCSAFESAARPGPGGPVLGAILGGNGLLLLLTVIAGVGGWRQRGSDSERQDHQVAGFLGVVGASSAVLFGLGIVLIALPPLFLEVCP